MIPLAIGIIQGHNRTQINLFPVSLDQSIDSGNEARVIDLFVESLSIKDLGFRMDFIENGRPAYHPSDLLKLFIYGYLNKLRSSRDLDAAVCSTLYRMKYRDLKRLLDRLTLWAIH